MVPSSPFAFFKRALLLVRAGKSAFLLREFIAECWHVGSISLFLSFHKSRSFLFSQYFSFPRSFRAYSIALTPSYHNLTPCLFVLTVPTFREYRICRAQRTVYSTATLRIKLLTDIVHQCWIFCACMCLKSTLVLDLGTICSDDKKTTKGDCLLSRYHHQGIDNKSR